MTSRSFVRCLLCQGALPPTKDEAVMEHFQDQHRVYFNVDFLFNSSFLEENDFSKTCSFIVSLILSTNEYQEQSIVTSVDTHFEDDLEIELDEVSAKQKQEYVEHDTVLKLPNMLEYHPVKVDIVNESAETENIQKKVVDEQENDNDQQVFPQPKIEELLDSLNYINSFPVAKLDSENENNEDKNMVFHCIKCDKLFPSKKKLGIHKIQTHDMRKNTCHICSKEVIGKKNLSDHMRAHKKQPCQKCGNSTMCTICKKYFNSSCMLDIHMSQCHTVKEKIKRKVPIYNCDKCDYSAKTKQNVTRHQLRHLKPEKPAIICNICNQHFDRPSKLKIHIESCKYKNQIFITM